MKKGIHPTYYPEAQVTCACGNSWTTGSTLEEIRTDVCSQCHPFFTGKQQRILDAAGQVERFNRRVEHAQQMQQAADERAQSRVVRERERRLVEIVDEQEAVEPIEGLSDSQE